MASNFMENDGEHLWTRTDGYDNTWSCDTHNKPITSYCKGHGVPLCQLCNINEHGEESCQLDNIGNVVENVGSKVAVKYIEVQKAKNRLNKLDSKIKSCATLVDNHLQLLHDEVTTVCADKRKVEEVEEQKEIRTINEEFDEEIRRINAERETRLKSSRDKAKQRQNVLEDTRRKLIEESQRIHEMVRNRMSELLGKNKDTISLVDRIAHSFEQIKKDAKDLVNKGPRVIDSLDGTLGTNFERDTKDCLDKIQREVQKIRLVVGTANGKDYSRLDGYIGKWNLVSSFHVQETVNNPWVCGCVSEDEMCVIDCKNNAFHITNMSKEQTNNVLGGDNTRIISCVPVNSDMIVCGKRVPNCSGEFLEGCITLYDRKWEPVRDITIPRNTSLSVSRVYVDVDRKGMILAAEHRQPHIYVIDPTNGRISHTITMEGNEISGEIQALSSGDIVVDTGINELTVVSRSGRTKDVLYRDEWSVSRCHVDKLTDMLYITYFKRDTCAVDQMSCDGTEYARIVEYELSYRSRDFSQSIITPSGRLVVCDGDMLFVYKKSFVM